jgi:very-short-patch-repair endonuclease
MRSKLHTPLARLAGAQHGVVSRDQLRDDIGLSDSAITRRIAGGGLIAVHRGVFAVGHAAITTRGRWWAAVLACGPDAALSHRAGGDLLDFWASARYDIDVIARRQVRQPGIDAHRHRLHPDDVTTRDGLPVTTVARTLLDLADVLTPRQLGQAYDRARINRLVTLEDLTTQLARANGRRGASKLRAIVDAERPPAATASHLERAFLDLIRAAGLPEPRVNEHVHGVKADFHWPEHRLIVETDGAQHAGRRAARADRRRDALLLVEGWRTLRFTSEDVLEDQRHVLAVLRPLLP